MFSIQKMFEEDAINWPPSISPPTRHRQRHNL